MRFICQECGGTDVDMSVILLEPLSDKKDGSGSRTAKIGEDAEVHCQACKHIGFVKLPELKGKTEVTF